MPAAQDDVKVSFDSVVDLSAFTIRIAQADVEKLPQILLAVSEERREEMRRSMARVWQRCVRARGWVEMALEGGPGERAGGGAWAGKRAMLKLCLATLKTRLPPLVLLPLQVYVFQLPPLCQAHPGASADECGGGQGGRQWQPATAAVAACHGARPGPCGG